MRPEWTRTREALRPRGGWGGTVGDVGGAWVEDGCEGKARGPLINPRSPSAVLLHEQVNREVVERVDLNELRADRDRIGTEGFAGVTELLV